MPLRPKARTRDGSLVFHAKHAGRVARGFGWMADGAGFGQELRPARVDAVAHDPRPPEQGRDGHPVQGSLETEGLLAQRHDSDLCPVTRPVGVQRTCPQRPWPRAQERCSACVATIGQRPSRYSPPQSTRKLGLSVTGDMTVATRTPKVSTGLSTGGP